jgi:hypothetical protein
MVIDSRYIPSFNTCVTYEAEAWETPGTRSWQIHTEESVAWRHSSWPAEVFSSVDGWNTATHFTDGLAYTVRLWPLTCSFKFKQATWTRFSCSWCCDFHCTLQWNNFGYCNGHWNLNVRAEFWWSNVYKRDHFEDHEVGWKDLCRIMSRRLKDEKLRKKLIQRHNATSIKNGH